MLPCSACILELCGGCDTNDSSQLCIPGDTLTLADPRLRALFDFLAAADRHIFTEEGLPKLRFFPELMEEVYAVSVELRVDL